MTLRALAALALGGSLFIFLSGSLQPVIAQQFTTAAPELIDRYRLTLSTDQGNLTLHYLLGVALLRNNQNAAALKELQVAYPAYQESIEAHYNLAIASLRLEDLPSTEIYLEQAVALGADDISGIFPVADLYFNMALKSQEMGDSNEAIRYFHKVLTLDPERYEVYRQLGDLYAHRGDTALALKSFHTYLEQFPDDPFSRDYLFALEFNHAQDLLAGNDLSGAENSFSTALELQPDSSTALYYLGYIAYAQHRPEQAVVLLNKAFLIADEPVRQTIRPLLYNSALALRKNGRLVSALNAASLLADHERALFNEVFLAGTLSLELGKHRAAYEYLQRAVTLEPNNQRAHQNLLAAELGAFNELLSVAKIHIRSVELADNWIRPVRLKPLYIFSMLRQLSKPEISPQPSTRSTPVSRFNLTILMGLPCATRSMLP
jgi:tetratricopeptide (TPR) repeat protein